MANTYLTHTTSTPTNSDKATLSFWLKRSKLSSGQGVFAQDTDGNDKFAFILGSNDTISIFQETAGTVDINLVTNRVFRDTSAWYNFVLHFDSTQGAGSNRVQLFVNGVQETSFSTATYPSSDVDFRFNKSGIVQEIGRYEGGNYFNGLLSHINFIDGTIYPASTFGSTDSTTGEWKINTSPSATYGTNGFFILKDGNSVTDQSGQSNNFTVGGGTLTKTEDNPSNVFATMNPLNHYTGQTFEAGNTVVKTISGNAVHQQFVSTLGISSGKFYWELKNHLATTSSSRIGISSENVISNPANLTGSDGHVGDDPQSYGYVASSGNKETNNSSSSYGNSFTNGDILMVALDMDNNKLYFGKNGTWQNSGDPTSGSTGTGSAFTVTSGLTYFPACSILGGGGESYQFNFGNGYFNTTAVSSAGTNASGNGIFEYDVPTGYTALSTKGLNL